MNIVQIMPFPKNGTDSIPLKLPDIRNRAADIARNEQIVGMALVEDSTGARSIEWVTWIPETRRIQVTDHYFQHFR